MRVLPIFLMWCMSVVIAGEQDDAIATYQVVFENISQQQIFDASIEAVHQATVSAQTGGRIKEVFFDVDDYVERDSVILRLRDTEQKARLNRAEAGLKEAEARLVEAKKEFARIEKIYKQKLVSRSSLDKAIAELKSARARNAAAVAQVQEAQEQLEHTVVKAPYSGIVVKRHVQAGETANIGQPLMTGISLDQLRAVVNLPQSLIEKVRTQGKAYVLLPDHEQGRLEATKIVIFPYADDRAHTFKIRLELPKGIKGLYPGMVVKIAFTTGEKKRMLVPASALVFRSEVTAVYVVVDDGKISLRQVRIGSKRGDGRVEVHAGLREGERIALDPFKAATNMKRSVD